MPSYAAATKGFRNDLSKVPSKEADSALRLGWCAGRGPWLLYQRRTHPSKAQWSVRKDIALL